MHLIWFGRFCSIFFVDHRFGSDMVVTATNMWGAIKITEVSEIFRGHDVGVNALESLNQLRDYRDMILLLSVKDTMYRDQWRLVRILVVI